MIGIPKSGKNMISERLPPKSDSMLLDTILF